MEWISVRERLPEPGQKVLVWIPKDKIHYEIAGYYPNEDFEWDTISHLAKFREVEYWAPLPEPPKFTGQPYQ